MLIGRRRCHRQSLRRVGRLRVDEERVKVERSTYDNRRLLLLLSNARPTISLARSPLQAQLWLSLHHLELSTRGSLGLSRHARASTQKARALTCGTQYESHFHLLSLLQNHSIITSHCLDRGPEIWPSAPVPNARGSIRYAKHSLYKLPIAAIKHDVSCEAEASCNRNKGLKSVRINWTYVLSEDRMMECRMVKLGPALH
jgi:hypothetical protein